MSKTPGTVKDQENRARDTFEEVKDRAQEAAQDAKERAEGMIDKVKEKGAAAISAAGDKTDQAAGKVGSGMQWTAEKVRDYSPEGGMVGSAAERAASSLESAGEYLEREGLSGVSRDLTEIIRRNPLPAVLLGVGVGYILARALRS